LAEFAETVRMVEDLVPSVYVEQAFLELNEPGILDGISRLVERGADRIVIAPLLLFSAGHAKRDIPSVLVQARHRHGSIAFCVSDPLGCHPALLRLSVRRFQEAVDQPVRLCSFTHVLVGRGGSDDEAAADLRRYAELMSRHVPAKSHSVAFMALARPRLRDALVCAARQGGDCVVQPHLLFQGDVLCDLQGEVSVIGKRSAQVHFHVTSHLGPSPLLAEAIVDRAAAHLAGLPTMRW
jgi:sirohydrochlorin ferrochelatase